MRTYRFKFRTIEDLDAFYSVFNQLFEINWDKSTKEAWGWIEDESLVREVNATTMEYGQLETNTVSSS